jgi:hypothetical protein
MSRMAFAVVVMSWVRPRKSPHPWGRAVFPGLHSLRYADTTRTMLVMTITYALGLAVASLWNLVAGSPSNPPPWRSLESSSWRLWRCWCGIGPGRRFSRRVHSRCLASKKQSAQRALLFCDHGSIAPDATAKTVCIYLAHPSTGGLRRLQLWLGMVRMRCENPS